MKKRNLALAMVLAMSMTTMGSATVFADDASDDAADYRAVSAHRNCGS